MRTRKLLTTLSIAWAGVLTSAGMAAAAEGGAAGGGGSGLEKVLQPLVDLLKPLL
ncbi:hypothetical protein [Streptomyces sp. ODS28]|uniref:hypothetical protein n=1 Tax=Streptomyces sp. ODS28 TaxID=3136688 RepID=UPI0031EED241